MSTRLPLVLELVRRRGHTVFEKARSANLVVVRGPGLPGEWDGLATLSYRDTATSGWTSHAWPCATRPGVPYLLRPINTAGTAVIEPGQYSLSHRRGLHKGRPALVQVRSVTVRRDADRDGVLEPGKLDAGNFAVNVHDVEHPNGLAGCIGLSKTHLDELLEVFEDLEPYNGEDVSLTVVEG